MYYRNFFCVYSLSFTFPSQVEEAPARRTFRLYQRQFYNGNQSMSFLSISIFNKLKENRFGVIFKKLT